MIPKFLYHYTTVESLEKILNSKTILFHRLDCLNDSYEGICNIFENNYFEFRTSLFCFCITDLEKESIALWEMYNKGKGIRIKIDSRIFGDFSGLKCIELGYIPYINQNNSIVIETRFGKIETKIIYGPIQIKYFDNFNNLTKIGVVNKIQNNVDKQNKKVTDIKILDLATKKIDAWSFENEWRYVIAPFSLFGAVEKTMKTYLDNPIKDFTISKELFIPFDIKENPFVEIICGPKISELDRVKIKEISHKYGIKIKNSVISINDSKSDY